MFKIFCITNRKLCKDDFVQTIKRVVSSNMKLTSDSNLPKPDMLILREKDLSEEEYYELAKKVKPMCDKAGVEMVIHTYVNVAKKLGVKSIHLPLGKCVMLTKEDKTNV